MNAGQAIALAQEWVELYGSKQPGFRGAHLMGALNALPRDAHFPAYKDVDLNLVVESPTSSDPTEVDYKGLILEYGQLREDRYRSPEQILADPELAPNLYADSILCDPTGRLSALRSVVQHAYARPMWVQARCEVEKRSMWEGLQRMRRAGSLREAFFARGYFIVGLTGLVAVANLQPPTHRRCLILTKQLLEANGSAELHEELLCTLGYQHLTRDRVEHYWRACAEVFDRAAAVVRSPVQFGFKLRPHVRPYIIDGAREMIDGGHHREAMFWIGGFLVIANGAIQADAPPADRAYFQAKVDELLADIGLQSLKAVAAQAQQVNTIAEKISTLADEWARNSAEAVAEPVA
ncbi:MAG: hypothetical protein ACT4QE_11335 [Anaerolineales bacterium]